jgi:hypothetical protein
MGFFRPWICLGLIFILTLAAQAAPFVVFPKASQLASPDGRYVVRNAERDAPLTEYSGAFHALYLEELSTGRTRKLCDYVGMAAVAWSQSNFIIVTQYLNKTTSRAVVFAADDSRDPLVLDKNGLTHLVPVEQRPQLRENDHVFVEASRLEGERLTLRVWGYGKHDPKGFQRQCEYGMMEGTISCRETVAALR